MNSENINTNGIKPLIELKNVSKVYHNNDDRSRMLAVANVTFSVHRGELVSIIGPSGCGKTTILNMVAGFIECTGGEILVNEKRVSGPSSDRTVIFQDHNLFPWMKVRQNVEFGLKAKNMDKRNRRMLAKKYIDLVSLTGFEDKYPHVLSGGMRQRVAIARALVLRPYCILMDEPFGALDTNLKGKMQVELLKYIIKEETTVLYVTHDIEEAIFLSDRIVILSPLPGKVLEVVSVPFGKDRTPDLKLDDSFREIKSIIHESMQ